MTRRIDHVCKECGGSMYWDATAYWDAEAQEWAAGDPNDFNACQDCGSENSAKVIDIDTGEELDTGPTDRTWHPKDEAKALWDAWRAENAKAQEAEQQERAVLKLATANAEALAACYS